MSTYAKAQERRVRKYLESLEGVDVLKYYGAQEKNCGDFLVRVWGADKRLRIDHKSTTREDGIRVQLDWLYKLGKESIGLSMTDGDCTCVITVSIKGHGTLYALSDVSFDLCPSLILPYTKPSKSKEVRLSDFMEVGDKTCMCLWFDYGVRLYILRLGVYIEQLRMAHYEPKKV